MVVLLTSWCPARAPVCSFEFWKDIPSKARSSFTVTQKYSEKGSKAVAWIPEKGKGKPLRSSMEGFIE